MRLLYFLFLLIPSVSFSQITFWIEDFGVGCDADNPAAGFVNLNGIWTVNSIGSDTFENEWYVSAAENGNVEGECGTGCGNDRTLHVGTTLLGDLGAAYFDGFATITDKRAESPAINCGGMSAISLEFLYMEGGNATDNASLWYYDGAIWSQLVDLPKTVLDCEPQGTWTLYSVAMPVSAQDNQNVKIGFRWVNDDDGIATDPSFAVDDISLTGTFGEDVTPPIIICPGDLTEQVFSGFDCVAFIQDYTLDAFVSDDTDPFPIVEQFPEPGEILTGPTLITLIVTDIAGNTDECSFMLFLEDAESPEIECPNTITATALPGNTNLFVNVPLPDVADCSNINSTTNDFNGTGNASGIYPIGTTEVTFTTTDEFGNSSDCSFTVTVLENTNQDCCLGDFNCDGVVSVLDLIILVGQFGCTTGCTADLDDDTIVGTTDMNIFISLYGNICPN